MQPIARLARLAVPDIVRKNDEIAVRVQHLAGTEQHARENRLQQAMPAAARAVHDQHRIRRAPARVARRRAERRVMQPQLRHRFARLEMEVVRHVIAFARLQRREHLLLALRLGLLRAQRDRSQQQNRRNRG